MHNPKILIRERHKGSRRTRKNTSSQYSVVPRSTLCDEAIFAQKGIASQTALAMMRATKFMKCGVVLLQFISVLSGSLLLAACAGAAGIQVAPPMVITVVVTPTGNGTTPDTSPTTPIAVTAPQTDVAAQYPAPFQNSVSAVYQEFENGFMIYLADRQVIWVFLRSLPSRTVGAWLAFPDTFKEGDPETDPALTPPATLQQPKRGFGKVWRENEGVRDAIGWALDFERPYTALVIDYSIGVFDANGIYTPQSFIHTVTALDSALLHIDEATRIWSKP